jgi:hypothetical protein
MSPFSKVEMSPFVLVEGKLQHESTEQVEFLLPMSQRELTRLEVIQRVKRIARWAKEKTSIEY